MADLNARTRAAWKPLLLASIGMLVCSSWTTAAQAEEYGVAPGVKHMALIIGNADYDLDGTIRTGPADVPAVGTLKDLKNPCRDAALLKEKLLAARWKPEEITAPPCNQTTEQMRNHITQFRQAVANATNTVVIFYFSGHGAQFSNVETSHSFLFGAGAKVDLVAAQASLRSAPGNTSFFATQAVDLHELLSTLGRQTENAVLLILDACRENPLYDQINGLSPSLRVSPLSNNPEDFPGIVVAYSTPSGQFSADGNGDYSIYTGALGGLLRHSSYLDSVLNKLRGKVAEEYRQQFPHRTGIQEPVTRGRFAGDWCVWACPPSSENGPVAALSDPQAVAMAAVEPAATRPLAPYPSTAALFTMAAFQESPPTPVAPPMTRRFGTTRTMTVFDKRELVRSTPPAPEEEGMRFDIFWCEGGAGADQRAERAQRLAAALAGEASEETAARSALPENLRRQISSVRVRALSASSNTISGYRYKDDLIVYDPGNKAEFGWANAVSRIADPGLTLAAEGSQTTGYMSIFVCKAPDEYALARTKVYLQVPDRNQRAPGRLLLQNLSTSLPALEIIDGIETRPDGPPRTEIRYYYQDDRDNAFATAAQMETLLKRGVKVKLMSKLAPTTKPGFLEVWLGSADPPLVVDQAGQVTSL
ncbi:caspase family protein [Sphingomonas sp.]|uniref:caspase family protein n=1 Tax=Sphingomonas sp. TaxID=28214 RepID=UPI00286DC015|nr:caspase family protein [Sphingomonas sp.]